MEVIQETHTNAGRFVLTREGQAYNLVAFDDAGHRQTLYKFTENQDVAQRYMELLVTEEVSPLHMADIWEDQFS